MRREIAFDPRPSALDERMHYGGPDRELGERLVNAGVRPIQIRHQAVCVHLDHGRADFNAEALRHDIAIRLETRRHGFTWTPQGIRKGSDLLHLADPPESSEPPEIRPAREAA